MNGYAEEDRYIPFGALDAPLEQNTTSEPAPLSVSAALKLAKNALAGIFSVTVTGEVSAFKGPNRSGHYYFDIKEKVFNQRTKKWEYQTLPLTVYKFEYAKYNIDLKDGDQIVCKGKFDIWATAGKFSLRPTSIEYAGEGILLKKYEEVEKRLRAQGIFDMPKKPIPEYCERVIMVTSASGEVRYDVASNINPLVKLGIVDAQIQGAGAAESIARGIRIADSYHPDAIIIGRGGGQGGVLGDFLPFFEEEVVLAIANCNAPVISSLGHHRNNPLANLVADEVCSTPSIAAKRVFPTVESLQKDNASHYQLLVSKMTATLSAARKDTVDNGRYMYGAMASSLREKRIQLEGFQNLECLASPEYLVRHPREELERSAEKLLGAMNQNLKNRQNALAEAGRSLHSSGLRIVPTSKQFLASISQQLDALSPLKVMTRGYSITRDSSGHAITSVEQVALGQEVSIMVAKGSFNAQVTSTNFQ